MRPQQVARAAWRAASSSGSRSRLLASSEAFSPTPTVRAAFASASVSPALPRPFSTSSSALKKKQKKVLVEEDFDEEFDEADDDDFISGDDGGSLDDPVPVATEVAAASAKPSAPKPVRKPSPYDADGVRLKFADQAGDYLELLAWERIDTGKKPSLRGWRRLAGDANSPAELNVVLELAKVYRDRIGPLGPQAGERFATRASAINLPEVALNGLMDRYINGLEYTLESLYLTMRSMAEKLSRGAPKALQLSASNPGTPAHRVDLFGTAAAPASTETPEEGEQTEAKPEEKVLQLARAKMTLADRLAMTASLTPTLSPTNSHDPLLLAFVPSALIKAYSLKKPAKPDSPPLDGVKARTNELISLLISVIDQSLLDNVPSAFLTEKADAVFAPNRARLLRFQLEGMIRYVALQDKSVEFRHPVSGKLLDPVRSVYRYMARVAPDQVWELFKTIEPFLQNQKPGQEEEIANAVKPYLQDENPAAKQKIAKPVKTSVKASGKSAGKLSGKASGKSSVKRSGKSSVKPSLSAESPAPEQPATKNV